MAVTLLISIAAAFTAAIAVGFSEAPLWVAVMTYPAVGSLSLIVIGAITAFKSTLTHNTVKEDSRGVPA